jgi:hypothetical protein
MNYSQIKRRIANFNDRSFTSGRFGISNEFGLIAIVYADNEQDALDAAVDSGKLDSELMSPEDHQEYLLNGWDDSFCYAGNASEPVWIENMAIGAI